ncbi:MAG: arabinosyltransferase domain-containing protein, partial [Mycobacterium sp.]|nr:arabinosyltransferase domain-containing protein [Mycobacterium sp.]
MSVTTVRNREDKTAPRQDIRVTRWVATIAGLIGFVLSVATPLLPVVQTTATLNWPQNGQLNSVTAPLISLTPVDVTVTVPCSVVRALPPEGGVVLSTAPKKGKDAALNGLFVVANSKRVDVTDRNVVIASVPRDQAMSPQCQRIEITSTRAGAYATFVGLTDSAGKPVRGGFPDPNLRPQIVGVFTDLTGPAPPGLRLSATIDTRFSTTPTTLKLAAMVLAIASTIVSLVALWRLDQLDGRRMRRLIPANWRTFTLADATVIFGFLLWHVIGANSSDDGYILGMARVAGPAGYMSNYFRWFGSPEDPFGWYYNLLALMTKVSDASLWMRLPDLVAGLVCWLLLSREVLPRLGPAVASSKPAMWAAGMVLLAAWMPFNNGLRPEPIVAVGSLITYVLIERSMRYSRMTPAALA